MTYICIYVCMYIYIYVCMYVCMHACMYVCMCVRVYVCMCVYTCIYVYMCVYVCICIYIYIYTKCIYVIIYVYLYVYMYVYIYIYKHIIISHDRIPTPRSSVGDCCLLSRWTSHPCGCAPRAGYATPHSLVETPTIRAAIFQRSAAGGLGNWSRWSAGTNH